MPLTNLPDEVTGYSLDDNGSFWSIVVPEETVNLVTNPNFQTELGYTFLNLTRVLSTEQIGSGVFGLKLTPNGSAGAVTIHYKETGSGAYTFSCDIYHEVGQTLGLQIVAGGVIGSYQFTTTYKGWGRYSVTAADSAAGGTGADRTVSLFNAASATKVFYTDRWQVEKKSYATTYCDGDQRDIGLNADPYAYVWEGQPHASRSRRSAMTDSGGRIVSLWDVIKFRTTAIVGLGLSKTEQETATFADGEEYVSRLRVPAREFSIVGKIYGESAEQLARRRQLLIDSVNPMRRRSGSLILRYQPISRSGNLYGLALSMTCSYIDGLDGNTTNDYVSSIELHFKAIDPLWSEDFRQGSLIHPDGFLDSGYNQAAFTGIATRDPLTGEWSALRDAGATADNVYCALFLPDGRLLVGGSIAIMAGRTARRLAVYDYNTGLWAEFGGGLNGDVLTLALGRGPMSNTVIVGGDFTAAATGGATLRRLAYYDLATSLWHELGSGLDDTVRTVCPVSDGNIFVGGDFLNDGLGNDRVRFTRWTEATNTFTALLAADGPVYSIIQGNGANLYVGGDIVGMGTGTPLVVNSVFRYNLLTGDYTVMENGLNGTVFVLAMGADGMVYAGGDFTGNVAGVAFTGFARFTGNTWEGVGNDHIQNVYSLAFDKRGIAYLGGSSGTVGTFDSENETVFYTWNGAQFIPFGPIAITGLPGQIIVGPNGRVVVTMGALTAAHFPGYTRVNYTGTGENRPQLTVIASSSEGYLYGLYNFTTNTHIFFQAVVIREGDYLTLDLGPGRPRLFSTNFGDITDQLYLGASDFAKFRMVPGYNDISAFVYSTDDTTLRVYLTWKINHASIEVAANGR